MKKYFIIAAFLCLSAGGSLLLFTIVLPGYNKGKIDDAIRLEDSIIIHGMQMESDTPLSDGGDEPEGRILYDDSFDDAIAGNDRDEKQADSDILLKKMKEFDDLRAKDRRWHLRRYKIRTMDNLWNISKRSGVDHRLVIDINGITNPGMLKPGRHLYVPSRSGVFYQVKKGDTVSGIAGRYKIPAKKIIAHNQLKTGLIRPGQKIFLPDASGLPGRHIDGSRQKTETAVIAADLHDFVWPLRGKITSGFGNRTDPISGQRRFHCGIDISANMGTPVAAASGGRVIFSGWKPGYGNVVVIRHKGGYISVYAHNSRNLADVDSTVSRGETVAYSGMTGAVTGAHLHFELRKYITPLNPVRFLR